MKLVLEHCTYCSVCQFQAGSATIIREAHFCSCALLVHKINAGMLSAFCAPLSSALYDHINNRYEGMLIVLDTSGFLYRRNKSDEDRSKDEMLASSVTSLH